MSETTIRRACGACGVAYVALVVLGNDVLGKAAANAPDWTASQAKIGHWLATHPPTTAEDVGGLLELLGLLAFVVFVAALAHAFRRRDTTPLPLVVLGAGFISAAVKFAGAPPMLEASTRAKQGLNAPLAAALVDMNGFAFGLTFALDGLLLGAAGILVLRTALLPRWLGWAGIVLAPLLIATFAAMPHVPPFAFVLGLLWFVAAGVTLAVRDREASSLEAPVPAF